MPKQRVGTPRQADIAREAGVSQATVSMVLAGTGGSRIPPDTQSRVLSAAKRLRYEPAAQRASGDVPYLPPLLGVHTFEPIFPTSVFDYYFEFLRGIEEQAAVEGCNLALFTAAHDTDGSRRIYDGSINRLLQANGSILLGHTTHRDELSRLSDEGYPYVYLGRRDVEDATVNYVGGDYRSATTRIVDELVAMGHQTFAYLGEHERDEPQTDRWEGFTAALTRFGLPTPDPVFTDPGKVTVQWLDAALASGTTAVLVESVDLLRVLAALIRLRNLTVPRDLSVVVLVDEPTEPVGARRWACLHVPRNDMGRRAVRLLLSVINEPDGAYARQLQLPCSYTLENSVGEPRPHAGP